MSQDVQAIEEILSPCPFCDDGTTQVQESTMWTGMRNIVVSVRVRHWCARKDGQPQSVLEVAGKTRVDAIANWNFRSSPKESEQS